MVDFRKFTVAHHFLQLQFPQSTEDFSCNHNTSLSEDSPRSTSLSGETLKDWNVVIC